jgi:uncharacterized membrane protein
VRIENTVDIAATKEQVWTAMEDVERWPEFAPQFKSIVLIDAPLAMGAEARVTPHGFFSAIWKVTEFEPNRLFTWESNMLPGLHLVAGHEIVPDGEGVKVTLSLESSGPMAGVLGLVLGRIFRRNVRQEAEGMKAHCEAA